MNNDFIITGIHNVIYVGKGEYTADEVTFKSEVTHNELIFHLSGEAIVTFNSKTMETHPNTIRFLPKGENRGYCVKNLVQGDCIDVFFDTDKSVSAEAFVTNLKNDTVTGSIFKKIFSLWVAKNNGYYYECISLLYKIFAQMQKGEYTSQNQYDKIKPAVLYIEENFLDQKIPIGYLAQICNISESYLKKLFIKNFGVSPIKYIIGLKINYACDLLRSGLYNITKVSEMCGYANLYYFSTQFKEYMEITPSDFIEKYKSSKN